ncbi:MAG: hypothetical protein J6N52_03895 [Clostridia bacterium]|nr:hypothetical protein [Clostridia bacterium]
MLKRVFKIFAAGSLLVCMLMNCMINISYAKETEDSSEQKKAVLTSLGILSEEPGKKIKYEIYVKAMLGFLYNTDAIAPEDYVISTGVLESGEQYDADAFVTLETAVKLAVETLGYAVEAHKTGYMATANKLGLYKGIDISEDSVLNSSEMITLLYNMLDVPPCVVSNIVGEEKKYEIPGGETLLSLKRDIFKVNGLMTANQYTSIYGSENIYKDHIQISGILYECDYPNADDLIGKNVEGYIYDNGIDTPRIMYVGEDSKKNGTVVIEPKDVISVNDYFTQFTYQENEKKKNIKLSNVLSVIFNGKFYSNYTREDLMPDNGSIEFIDNNSDNVYDIAVVTSYQTMLVQSINSTDKIIRNALEFDGARETLELGDDVIYSIYGEAGEIEFSDIEVQNILSVAMSKDTEDALCKIYVSSQITEGNLDSKDTDNKKITIDGQEYDMSGDMLSLIKSGKTLSVGKSYMFYMDFFNQPVNFKVVLDQPYYVLRRITADDSDETLYARYMDFNGEWTTSEFAAKINCDGVSGDTVKFGNKLRSLEPQIVKLNFNKDGKINKIMIAKQNSPYNEDVFRRTETADRSYYGESRSFDTQYFFDAAATTVVIPNEPNQSNEELYYITNASSVFDENKGYTVSLYDPDEFNFVSLISYISDTADAAGNKNYKIVVSKGEMLSSTDEVLPYVEVYTVDLCGMKYLGADERVFDDVNVGDVIATHSNAQGRVDDVNKLFSLNDPFIPYAPANLHNENLKISGTVEKIDFEKKRIKLNCGSTVNLRIDENTSVVVYDKSDGKCEIIPAAHLQRADNLHIRMWYAVIQEVVCVRE